MGWRKHDGIMHASQTENSLNFWNLPSLMASEILAQPDHNSVYIAKELGGKLEKLRVHYISDVHLNHNFITVQVPAITLLSTAA